MKAYLNAGRDFPGAWRDLKLESSDQGIASWEGRINPSDSLVLHEHGTRRKIVGAKRRNLFSWLWVGEWDFHLDGLLIGSAHSKREGKRGTLIGDEFYPMSVDGYQKSPKIAGHDWTLDRVSSERFDIAIEADRETTLLAVSCVAALYENILAQSG